MSIIDTTHWAKFMISDIFETDKKGKKLQVPTGASVEKKNLVENGSTPRITVTGINNGIFGKFDCNITTNNYRVFNNFISVSFLGTVFYHSYAASLDMKVHCLKPLNISLSKYIGQYLVSVLRKHIAESTYAEQISSTVLPEMEIILPVNGKNMDVPDYAYMEQYMRNLETITSKSLNDLKKLNNEKKTLVVTKKWKEFQIGSLFTVVKGSRLTKANMKDGNIRYIGASSFNNGITAYISNNGHIHPAKTLTVSYNGSDIGRTFYQSEPYWATDDVNVLYPKFELNEDIALFISPIIKSVGGLHEYVDKWKKEDMEKSLIKLPSNQDGTPNFQYMEVYIRQVKEKARKTIILLNN